MSWHICCHRTVSMALRRPTPRRTSYLEPFSPRSLHLHSLTLSRILPADFAALVPGLPTSSSLPYNVPKLASMKLSTVLLLVVVLCAVIDTVQGGPLSWLDYWLCCLFNIRCDNGVNTTPTTTTTTPAPAIATTGEPTTVPEAGATTDAPEPTTTQVSNLLHTLALGQEKVHCRNHLLNLFCSCFNRLILHTSSRKNWDMYGDFVIGFDLFFTV